MQLKDFLSHARAFERAEHQAREITGEAAPAAINKVQQNNPQQNKAHNKRKRYKSRGRSTKVLRAHVPNHRIKRRIKSATNAEDPTHIRESVQQQMQRVNTATRRVTTLQYVA